MEGNFKIETVHSNNTILSSKEEEVYDRIIGDFKSVREIFNEKNAEGDRNQQFTYGQQWSEAELEAHYKQMRYPFTFNEILPAVQHLQGSQQLTRMDTKAVAREPGDEAQAQLLTYLLKWVEQTNRIEYVESQVFHSGVVRGAGVAMVRWVNEDMLYGYPKIEYFPTNQFYFDLNAIQPNLSDARWTGRVCWITKADAKERYPELQDYIDSVQGDSHDIISSDDNKTKLQRRMSYTLHETSRTDRELIQLIEHCEKIKIHNYIVIDDVSNNVQTFDTKQEAITYYEELINGYADNNINFLDDSGDSKVVYATTSSNRIVYSVVLGDKVVERSLTALTESPYVPMFAYWSDGEFYSVVSQFISPQIAVNRAYSQWDYMIGASQKNMTTVVESLLRRGWTIENVRNEGSKTAPYIPVMDHNAIQSHAYQQANPQLMQNVGFAIERMVDYSGGKNVRGFTENAAESGKAVIARAEQGGVSKLTVFDMLRLWRIGIAERVIWYLKNMMSPNQIVRIIGNQEDVMYVELNDDILDSLQEIKIDIIVDEATKSDAMKERILTDLSQFFNAAGAGIPEPIKASMLIEYTSLPESKKEEIKAQLDAWQKEQQAQLQQAKQQQMEQQVTDSLTKKQMKQQAENKDVLAESQDELDKQKKSIETQIENVQQKQQQLQEQALKATY